MYTLGGLSSATLPRLQHLTFLHFVCLSVENLLQLGTLTSLQDLWLRVCDSAGDVAIGPSSVPGLKFPASLKTLLLLSPVEAGLLSCVPTGLESLKVADHVEGPAEGPSSFLSCIAQLQHLTKLDLALLTYWIPASPAYLALTSSSNLVELLLSFSCPKGVWQFVFPAARKIPHLTYLYLGDRDEFDGNGGAGDAVAPSWSAADLSSLVSCCPGLRDIECLHLQPEPHAHASELQQLTALQSLTRLCVCYGPEVHPLTLKSSMDGLTAVKQLRDLLVIALGDEFTYAYLLPLTRLAALTALRVDRDSGFDWDAYASAQVSTVCGSVAACRVFFVLLYQSLSHHDNTLAAAGMRTLQHSEAC
jgi:hypothetical protein